MEDSQYCVLWNNYHGSLVATLSSLRREGHLVDVTVVCHDGSKVKAHQLILAACSTYFRDFLKDNPSKHPYVLLPTEISYPELKAMVEFMYTGQVCVQQERLQSFIRGARYLRIKGLEDSGEDSDIEDIADVDIDREKQGVTSTTAIEDSNKTSTTISNKSRKIKDHRYSQQQIELADSDENKEKWEVVERKPVLLPPHNDSILQTGSGRRRRRIRSAMRKRAMHLSNHIVCYKQKSDGSDLAQDHSEPINKIRRLSSPGMLHDEDLDICTCTSRKIWSVADLETLLKVWNETLTQVPPSYFIRSMSLCKRVARRLQGRGVQKNWRQCQVKMKNLRREVKLYKESMGRNNISRKPSEVANACQKLLPDIESIFNKEQEIRRKWRKIRAEDRLRDDDRIVDVDNSSRDILAQVAVLADSDLCDDDTDGQGLETEGEGAFTEGEGGDGFAAAVDAPHHSIERQPDGCVHHIVENVTLQVMTKSEPLSSGTEL